MKKQWMKAGDSTSYLQNSNFKPSLKVPKNVSQNHNNIQFVSNNWTRWNKLIQCKVTTWLHLYNSALSVVTKQSHLLLLLLWCYPDITDWAKDRGISDVIHQHVARITHEAYLQLNISFLRRHENVRYWGVGFYPQAGCGAQLKPTNNLPGVAL